MRHEATPRASRRARTIQLSVVMGAALGAASLIVASAAHAAPAANPTPPTIDVTLGEGHVELSTSPGAAKTLWVVFDAGTLMYTRWNDMRDRRQEAVDWDDPMPFAAAHGATAQFRTEVVQRLGELFAPFDINVTTVRPDSADLARETPSDTRYGGVAIITSDTLAHLGIGNGLQGIANGDSFGDAGQFHAWVTTAGIEGNAKAAAEVTAHEVAHTLGLNHHGFGDEEYYTPTGLWGPVMGATYSVGLARWSDGDYPNANNPNQDDIAVMSTSVAWLRDDAWLRDTHETFEWNRHSCQGDGERWLSTTDAEDGCAQPADERRYIDWERNFSGRLTLRADDHSNAPGGATALEVAAGPASVAGVIGAGGDVDLFTVTLPSSGMLTVDGLVAPMGNTLDMRVEVLDQTEAVVASWNPDLVPVGNGVDGDNAGGVLPHLAAGTYYVRVSGVGFGDLSQITARDTSMAAAAYGSVGRFTLNAVFSPDPVLVEFASDVVATTEAGGDSPALVVSGWLRADTVVTVTASGGDAAAGTDFTAPATITVPAGSHMGTVIPLAGFTVTDDLDVEGDETVQLALAPADPAALLIADANADNVIRGTALVTIGDDDTEPTEPATGGGETPAAPTDPAVAAAVTAEAAIAGHLAQTGGGSTAGAVGLGGAVLVAGGVLAVRRRWKRARGPRDRRHAHRVKSATPSFLDEDFSGVLRNIRGDRPSPW